MSQLIEIFIVCSFGFAVLSWRNHHLHSLAFSLLDDCIAIVPLSRSSRIREDRGQVGLILSEFVYPF
jgi:hypothetical protein